MSLHNTQVTVILIDETSVVLETELQQKISINKDLLSEVALGDIVYISADTKPVATADPKEILNEIIHGGEKKS